VRLRVISAREVDGDGYILPGSAVSNSVTETAPPPPPSPSFVIPLVGVPVSQSDEYAAAADGQQTVLPIRTTAENSNAADSEPEQMNTEDTDDELVVSDLLPPPKPKPKVTRLTRVSASTRR